LINLVTSQSRVLYDDKMTQDITKLYQTQISLSRWFGMINHPKTAELSSEDNEKRERLKILHELIGLKYDKPYQFSCVDMTNQTAEFQTFLKEHGHELCALRVIPYTPELPRLRMRGKSVKDVMQWFAEQKVNPEDYRADFVPHAEKSTWGTIFVVNKHGIFGEIIRGGHHQLTQGFYESKPMVFSYDFERWTIQPLHDEALAYVKEIVSCICVDSEKKKQVAEQMNGKFHKKYLAGYFETAASEEFGTWFIDYSPLLGELFENDRVQIGETTIQPTTQTDLIRGMGCNRGKARGRVRIVRDLTTEFQDGEILVCAMTTPELVPLMQRASAIVTDLGGILCHAAIISRELGKPCVVGTEKSTKLLKDGDIVEVDAENGVVVRL